MAYEINGTYHKHKRLLNWVQLLLLVFILPVQASTEVKDSVSIVVDDYPPYIDKANTDGAVTRLVSAAFAAEGIDVELEFAPWSKVEESVHYNNKLSFMWSKTAQRQQNWSFSDPLYVNRQVLVIKKGSRVFWRRLDELRRYKLGVTSHHNYGERFENYRQYLNLTDSVSDYLSIKKLIRDKVDAVVVEELVGRSLISYFPEKISAQLEVLGHEAIDSSNSYLVCSKNYAKCANYIGKFNRGLTKLKTSGRYQEILTKGL